MPFIEDVLKYKSISFVGMEKNAGKTQTLNYVLSRLRTFSNLKLAISSIGVDGETLDIVTSTSKPEIEIYPNTTFITSQSLYNQKRNSKCHRRSIKRLHSLRQTHNRTSHNPRKSPTWRSKRHKKPKKTLRKIRKKRRFNSNRRCFIEKKLWLTHNNRCNDTLNRSLTLSLTQRCGKKDKIHLSNDTTTTISKYTRRTITKHRKRNLCNHRRRNNRFKNPFPNDD